ncbi:uncharacterized protein [Parasteatoda tepidariorum]|nr:uncharacterized protein LOC107442333 [Parasteatoda tepidariorum]
MGKNEIAFFIFTLSIVFAEEKEDYGQYGNYNLWRQTLCERDDDALNRDVQNCMTYENSHFYRSWKCCLEEILPNAKGSFIVYQKTACENKFIYYMTDECIDKRKAVKTKMQMNEPAAICFDDILKKHDLTELRKYFFDEE